GGWRVLGVPWDPRPDKERGRVGLVVLVWSAEEAAVRRAAIACPRHAGSAGHPRPHAAEAAARAEAGTGGSHGTRSTGPAGTSVSGTAAVGRAAPSGHPGTAQSSGPSRPGQLTPPRKSAGAHARPAHSSQPSRHR